ncbi:hypothetical protein [Bdellovibrio sp. HCB2-146]|uniref:hypothetical protein n=1 Tax=Bdellovibrio sp. HCB2-146 TaxID=3394362 RepID=UPI0039BCC91E
MKSVSLVIGLSLLSSVSFAKTDITNQVEAIRCSTIVEQKASKRISSTSSKGSVVVGVIFQDSHKQNNLEIFKLSSVEIETEGDLAGLTVKLANATGSAELDIDEAGSSTLVVNGLAQDLLNLQCTVDFKAQ